MRVGAAVDWPDRQVSAAEAVAVVRPGDRVFVGSACATPRALVAALEDLKRPGVVLVHFLTDRVGTGDPPRTSYRHRVFYVGRDVRDLHEVPPLREAGKVEYVPVVLADVPKLFQCGQMPLDVAMVQVAPPDPDGTCSLGVSVDVTKAAALAARTVIAEVNPAMPRTAGDSRIAVDRIACFVPVQTPVVEYIHEPVGDVAEQIARYVARLIDDRSTVQVGLGRVPNEMLARLSNRRDLAIHSLGERAIALIEIAHPDFRAQLLDVAIERGFVGAKQQLRSRTAYPVAEVRDVRLRDGRDVRLRPTRTSDTRAMQDLFYNDRETRFLHKLSSLTDTAAQYLCSVSYEDEMAFAAVVGPSAHERIVAASCYYLNAATGLAEVAYMVDPEWQGLGLGTILHARLVEYGREHGARGLTAEVLFRNARMMRVFERGNHSLNVQTHGGVRELRMLF